MKIDYDKMAAYFKRNKKMLDAMSDQEFNLHLACILEEFHYAEQSPEKEGQEGS